MVLMSVLAVPLCAAASKTVPRTQAQLRALAQRIDAATAQVSQDAIAHDRQAKSLRAAELALTGARSELDQLHSQYASLSAQRDKLAAERTQQQAALGRERDALSGQLRAAYMLGRQEPLKLLLNQRDPLHSARLFTYYGYFGRARADQIGEIKTRVQRIDALDTQLAANQSHLDALKDAQQTQLTALQQARDQREQVMVSLTQQARSHSQSLARLKTQQADLGKLLEQLTRSLKSEAPPDNATAFGRLRGKLDWPVDGRMLADYGATRASGVKWDGLMVAAARGSPVRAIAAGRVVYADWLPGLGLLVIIDHGGGYLSLYGHNDRLYKATGERVSAGDIIAAAGDSGGRSDPALYFEIRHGGKPVNPHPWFRQRNP